MNLRAVILDVYGTLLDIGAPPSPDTIDAAWEALHRDNWHAPAVMPFARFAAECRARIDHEHAVARALGIRHPEVCWPDIVAGVLPALESLSPAARSTFLVRLAGLSRTLRLAPGAGDLLRALHRRGVLLGIASNAQAYTLTELSEALGSVGLPRSIFQPSLCFWSFENGFSKPDPHVFRLLAARLRGFEIAPSETLMVGDRLDNDIAPARAAGWRTWHLHPDGDGSWTKLASRLDSPGQPSVP